MTKSAKKLTIKERLEKLQDKRLHPSTYKPKKSSSLDVFKKKNKKLLEKSKQRKKLASAVVANWIMEGKKKSHRKSRRKKSRRKVRRKSRRKSRKKSRRKSGRRKSRRKVRKSRRKKSRRKVSRRKSHRKKSRRKVSRRKSRRKSNFKLWGALRRRSPFSKRMSEEEIKRRQRAFFGRRGGKARYGQSRTPWALAEPTSQFDREEQARKSRATEKARKQWLADQYAKRRKPGTFYVRPSRKFDGETLDETTLRAAANAQMAKATEDTSYIRMQTRLKNL